MLRYVTCVTAAARFQGFAFVLTSSRLHAPPAHAMILGNKSCEQSIGAHEARYD